MTPISHWASTGLRKRSRLAKLNNSGLWSLVAECLETFITKHSLSGNDDELIPFRFTFSYPAAHNFIDHGVLQTWTKGFDINGVEGEDAASQLKVAIAKTSLLIRLVALINDTTGAMIISSYYDPETVIEAIFGTGCNAAYMERAGSIPKLKNVGLSVERELAISCEYGAFDNGHRVLPCNKYDVQIDIRSHLGLVSRLSRN